jgi:hypothetical protein
MCQKFKSKIPLVSDIFDSIKPKLECPLKVQNYTIKDTLISLDMFTKLPIGNYLWALKLEMFSGHKNNLKHVICTDVDVAIVDK